MLNITHTHAYLFRLSHRQQQSVIKSHDQLHKRNLTVTLNQVLFLFLLFIFLCGWTHFLSFLEAMIGPSAAMKLAKYIVLISTAVVSFTAAVFVSIAYPVFMNALGQFELTKEGFVLAIQNELQAAQFSINDAKMKYITCTAHDLKTPLQSFEYSLTLLRETELTVEQKHLVEDSAIAVDLMRLTIAQAMDISKSLSGMELVPHMTTIRLSQILERVKVIISGFGSQVPISFHLRPTLEDCIITDEEWVWQMLLNLLTNACKYTDSGSIECYIESADDGRYVKFRVVDTGIGISDLKKDSLFLAFSQIQSSQTTGTGLGLYGLKVRADRLGGSCGVLDNHPRGSVFWFTIPYLIDHHEISGHKATAISNCCPIPEKPAPAAWMKTKVIPINTQVELDEANSNNSFTANRQRLISEGSSGPLPAKSANSSVSISISIQPNPSSHVPIRKYSALVIDDVFSIRKMLGQILIREGFDEVHSAENGSKGLEAMKEKWFDVVFMDLQMPVMSGSEVGDVIMLR
jgi:signal transduction histidine kinase